MTRAEAVRRIEEVRIIPVLRLRSAELASRAIDALLDGGLTVFEVTLTIPDAFAAIRSLTQRLGHRALIGAGTVLGPDDARASIEAGAEFLVSPGLEPRVLAVAQEKDVAAIPGALTPTEVMAAVGLGADCVKIFPCSAVGGPKYLRALRGPLPRVKLIPTGGVTLTNAHEYLAAGAVAVGIGSELVDDALLEAADHAVLTTRARDLAEACRRVTPSPRPTSNR
jgi:2-dehydro-3-deoxyphosphogluconate aldolase/(4S)-4-hydroxy-2-oxoglutarate aldolase